MPADTVIRAVLFDFDGTLWDAESSIFQAYAVSFEECGQQLSHQLWSALVGTIGFDIWQQLEQLTGAAVERDRIEERTQRRKARLLSKLGPRPGIRYFLDAVDRSGLARGIVSNSSRRWITKYSRQCGLSDGWAVVASADGDRARAKPRPDLYQAALAALGLEPHEVVAFEDSPTGIAAAKGAGICCVAVPNAMTAGLDLSYADLCLESYEQVDPNEVLAALAGPSPVVIAAAG